MKKREEKPGYARLLDAWIPPESAGEPVGCVATTFTFTPSFFEEECLGRFVSLQSDPVDDKGVFLIEREEKLSQLACAAVLVDQRHAKGLRSLRWDLLSARLPAGILHAKISLLLWSNAARIIIASANLTEDGYRRNREVFGVLDFSPDGEAPVDVLVESVAFLREASRYSDPKAEKPGLALKRMEDFLSRFEGIIAAWNLADLPPRSPVKVQALFTGPGRPDLIRSLGSVWKDASPASSAWVVSPFFDPPEAPNTPAKEIWKLLRKRGDAAVAYCLVGQETDSSGEILLLGPESLRSRPENPSGAIEFERVDPDPTRPLHAKCLYFEGGSSLLYVLGSSNFTSAGLGLGTVQNLEANLAYLAKDSKQERAAFDAAWIDADPVPSDTRLIPPADQGEDSENSGDPLLPPGFGAATFGLDATGKAQIELTFHEPPTSGWELFPDDSDTCFLSASAWTADGEPNLFTRIWEMPRPPAGFRVVFAGKDGAAWWPINVANGAALPPPAELSGLSLEALIEILTSARPLHLALRRILARSAAVTASSALDPHQRVDTSEFLLQRTRRVSWALEGLGKRLEKPVPSLDSLRWRLDGPVGVMALAKAISREARSAEERSFLIGELMLELARRKTTTVTGGPSRREIQAEVKRVTADLRGLLGEAPTTDPRLQDYLDRTIQLTQ
jgi:hypothetical protein